MFLCIRNPWGQVTSIDLLGTPVWRLGLKAIRFDTDAVEHSTWLCVVVSYVAGGTMAHAPIVALQLRGTTEEAGKIAAVGMPKTDRNGNKDRLREAAKILINTMNQGEVDDIIPKLGSLVEAYYDFLEGTFMVKGPTKLTDIAAPVRDFEGWQWALTESRFEQWMRPKGALSVPSFSSGGVGAPPPGGGGGEMPPPPGSDAGNHPPPGQLPPAQPTKRPSREQRRVATLPAGMGELPPGSPLPGDQPVAPLGMQPLTAAPGGAEPEELKPE